MNQQELEQLKKIKGAIIKTIAFFDMFFYPLTFFEIRKYLGEKVDWHVLSLLIDDLTVSGRLIKRKGFFCLPGREDVVNLRQQKLNVYNRKLKKALRVAKIFSYIPWIKYIALVNSIGSHNLNEDGDIDLLIITSNNRLWLSRLFTVLIISLLGQRPKYNDVRDKICLSFFLSEKRMNMENLQITNDIYFKYWFSNINTLYNSSGTYHKLIEANQWLKKALPNWKESIFHKNNIKARGSVFYRDVWDMLFAGLEKFVYKIQIKKFPRSISLQLKEPGSSVLINRDIIKLHTNDRRRYFFDEWQRRIKMF